MPQGVAMKLSADSALYLGLQLLDASLNPLSGTSGVEVPRVVPDQVEHTAELLLAGPQRFLLPPHQRTTIRNDCPIRQKQTVFALWPHMHELGSTTRRP